VTSWTANALGLVAPSVLIEDPHCRLIDGLRARHFVCQHSATPRLVNEPNVQSVTISRILFKVFINTSISDLSLEQTPQVPNLKCITPKRGWRTQTPDWTSDARSC